MEVDEIGCAGQCGHGPSAMQVSNQKGRCVRNARHDGRSVDAARIARVHRAACRAAIPAGTVLLPQQNAHARAARRNAGIACLRHAGRPSIRKSQRWHDCC
ncbi:hypothetical protein EGT47_10845 [Burkholderia cenocepacia]|nr:hypothetical protein EGT47_10845 [Burkholderia cenocepacia]